MSTEAGALRHRLVGPRIGQYALVGAVTLAVLGLIGGLVSETSQTSEHVEDLSYSTAGMASVSRETMKMQLAAERGGPTAIDDIRLRRKLMAQQMRLAMPDMRSYRPAARTLTSFDAALAEADVWIETSDEPTPQLLAVLERLEVATKQLANHAEFRQSQNTRNALAHKTRAQQYIAVLAALALAAGAAVTCKLRRAARLDLRAKAAELTATLERLEGVRHDRDRLLSGTIQMIEAQRTRLAAELHDGPIQALATVCLRLDRLGSRLEAGHLADTAELAEGAREALADEIGSLRRLMSELRPPALDEGGLHGALRDYCAGFVRRTSIDCAVEVDGDATSLAAETETTLYRIGQEALANVARHARASRVTVRLSVGTDGTAVLVVEDDGVGFDVSLRRDFIRDDHFGLAGMAERLEMIGGTLSMDSVPGGGTTITGTVPGAAAPTVSTAGVRSAA